LHPKYSTITDTSAGQRIFRGLSFFVGPTEAPSDEIVGALLKASGATLTAADKADCLVFGKL
jgi:hypothetical protein